MFKFINTVNGKKSLKCRNEFTLWDEVDLILELKVTVIVTSNRSQKSNSDADPGVTWWTISLEHENYYDTFCL